MLCPVPAILSATVGTPDRRWAFGQIGVGRGWPRWHIGRAVLVLTGWLIAAASGCGDRDGGTAQIASPGQASPAATAPAQATDERIRLIGDWLRSDGGYVLTVRAVNGDGTVVAAYRNPQPINVSRAVCTIDHGRLVLAVELRDRGYPGSYYTLTHDPRSDRLVGVYHHLGIGQSFEVVFERSKAEALRLRE